MSIPDIRLVYMNLVAALLVFVAGILSFMSPECHVVLLAILFIVGGEAAFVTWGMDRVHHPEADQRPLKFLVYIGLSAILMAVVILFFRSYLQMYAIQFTAVLLILAFIMQCVLSNNIYRVLKNRGSFTLMIVSFFFLFMTLPFLFYPPFSPGLRSVIIGILSFACTTTILFGFFQARKSVIQAVR